MTYAGAWSLTDGLSIGNYSGGNDSFVNDAGRRGDLHLHESVRAHAVFGNEIFGRRLVRGDFGRRRVGGNAEIWNWRARTCWCGIRWASTRRVAHTITLTNAGASGELFYFDFVEAAVPTTALPTFPNEPKMTLATDWDTLHSQALAPERTAWLIDTLGFAARSNHYAGALWFYELVNSGNVYATATVTFAGGPDTNPAVTDSVTLTVAGVALTKLIHMGDTAETLATGVCERA